MHLLRSALRFPPHLLPALTWMRLRREINTRVGRARDARWPGLRLAEGRAELHSLIPAEVIAAQSAPDEAAIRAWCDHRFDLLGSGPVQVKHGAQVYGFEEYRYDPGPAIDADPAGAWLAGRIDAANLVAAQAIWKLIHPGYLPIDWQLDFRSGWRWSEETWFRDIRFGDRPGVDVKLPWELARMQHLPLIALAYRAAPRPVYLAAFRDQILDFIAQNPPRRGVNWVTAMDVAIRAVNWLIAWDIFEGSGATFDDEFRGVFSASLIAHGRHIRRNLERAPDHRGNHYLADLAGLALLGAFLPDHPQGRHWLRFAARTLPAEIRYQFHAEGTHFEGSTAYHRFCTEMAAWGIAALRWRGMIIPPEVDQRLANAVQFTREVSLPNGDFLQIGDNDSGRFTALDPLPLLAVKPMYGGFSEAVGVASPLPGTMQSIRISLPPEAITSLELRAYPAFGLYLWRGPRLLVSMRCGPIGAHGLGTHDHNDQLAVAIWLDGRWLIEDPGSYVYTALPELRNSYRSVRAHFAPQVRLRSDEPDGGLLEPARLDQGLFRLGKPPQARCDWASRRSFHGTCEAYGAWVSRELRFSTEWLEITDVLADSPCELLSLEFPWQPPVDFSPGYGLRIPR